MRIGTWNIRSLYQTGYWESLVAGINKYRKFHLMWNPPRQHESAAVGNELSHNTEQTMVDSEKCNKGGHIIGTLLLPSIYSTFLHTY
jgi:hypothetical protein